jgi:hypothetical protein
MERLRQEIFAHETVHYRASAQLRRDFALHAFYERVFLPVSEDSMTRRTEVFFYLKSRDYMRALSASDSTIDEPALTTSLTCTMRLP